MAEGSVDLKTLATAGSLLMLLVGAGSTAGVAIYRVDKAEDKIETHLELSGHGPLLARVEGQKESLAELKQRLAALQVSVNKNEKNQIRICVAVGANCED